MPTIHAFDYLAAPDQYPAAAVNVLFGDESFLRTLVLAELRKSIAAGRQEAQSTTFPVETPWRDVADELATASLFGGGGKRLVQIEDADKFVSEHRARLEDYVAKPKSTSALVLAVDTWAANTKLYKAVDAAGLQVECGVPSRKVGRNKVVDLAKLSKWLVAWAKARHHLALEGQAADELIQITPESSLGIIDQELAKIALYVPAGAKVTAAQVKEIVGGWRMRTAWQMLDDVAEGNTAAGLEQLHHLLEDADPLAIFGPMSWSLRRYTVATRIVSAQQRRKQAVNLMGAAKEAALGYNSEDLQKAERQLRQLSAVRAGKMIHWLLATDLALKGSHAGKERSRLPLELLVVKCGKQFAPAKK